MLWRKSYRRKLADTQRGLSKRTSANAAKLFANAGNMTADAESKALELSSVAIDHLFARIDDLGEALSNVSRDAALMARTRADSVLDDLFDEFRAHPLRSLVIAVGIGMTAGVYTRK